LFSHIRIRKPVAAEAAGLLRFKQEIPAMLKISLTSEAADGLRALLEKEESSDARLRIREFRSGCGG